MIRGLHGLFYSSRAEEMRAFLRDKLRLPYTDVGEGWLIFDMPAADLGVHPVEGDVALAGKHDVSFWCDDIRGTVADLEKRGVPFTGPIEDRGYGYVTFFTMPGGVQVQLYEPRYRKRAPAASGSAKPARSASKGRAAPTKRKPARR